MPREHVVTLRVNDAELAELDRQAEERGLTRAEYIRRAVLDDEHAPITRSEFEALADRVHELEQASTSVVDASTPGEYTASTTDHDAPDLSWYDYNDAHRDAVVAVWRYVRERGRIEENPRTQIIDDCFDGHNAGRRSKDTWWTHVVKHGVLETPEVERPNQRVIEWVG